MKLTRILCLIFFLPLAIWAQPKTTKKDKPPTKADMDQMTKDLQKAMNGLDPEAKRFMDSLGIKMPSGANMPAYTDANLAQAVADEERVIPARRANLIAKVPTRVLSATELLANLKAFNEAMAKHVSAADKAFGDQVLNRFSGDPNGWAMVAAAANGMWMLGMHSASIYLMGKAAVGMPNADNLNNLSAYLTMVGAPHRAIPILDLLNQAHPGNSTVLNNLGQAWFGLGDITRSEQYLDQAISAYPYHPQANYTKALILNEHGRKAEAITALKRSLQHSVTKSRLNRLRAWEGKTKEPYYPKRPVPQVYTSTTFSIYKYLDKMPLNYASTAGKEMDKPWQAFFEEMREEATRLNESIEKNSAAVAQSAKDFGRSGRRGATTIPSPYYLRAVDDVGHGLSNEELDREIRQDAEATQAYLTNWGKLESAFHHSLDSATEDIERNAPAGSPLLMNSCPVKLPIVNKYVKAINKLNKDFRELSIRRWYTNAYKRYNHLMTTSPDESAALDAVMRIKLDLVNKLLMLKHESYDMPACVTEEPLSVPASNGPMTDFDEAHCKDTSVFWVPLTGKITVMCNKMKVEYTSKALPITGSATWNYVGNNNMLTEASISVSVYEADISAGAEFDKEGAFKKGKVGVEKEIAGAKGKLEVEFTDEGFEKATLEFSTDEKIKLLPKSVTEAAPLDASLKGTLGVGIEIGKEGVEDFYVKQDKSLSMGMAAETDAEKQKKDAVELPYELDEQVKDNHFINIEQTKLTSGVSVKASDRWGVSSGHTVKVTSDTNWLSND